MVDEPINNLPRATSERKIVANRANSLRSTGPRTEQGKARTRLNSITHGIYSCLPANEEQQCKDAAEAMDADARIERIQRMSATEGKPMSADDQRLVLNNIKEYVLKKQLISSTQLARMAASSPSAISELLRGKYRGDVPALLARCDSAIAEFARREDSPDSAQFVTTRFAQRIFSILKLASKMQTMAAFYCVSGTGKSMALRASLRLDFKNAIYIECNTGNSAPLNLLQSLLGMLYTRGLRPDAIRNKGMAFNKVVEKLHNTGRMLLIDEADCLPPKSLNILRQIHDATGTPDNPCPIVLAGRPNLKTAIDRTMKCSEIGGSLRGRISIEHNLMPQAGTNPSDGGKWLFSVEEIIAMLAKRRIQITRDAARWLCCLANLSLMSNELEKGGPRFAIKVALNAAALNKTGRPVDREMLIRAHRLASEADDVANMEAMIDGAMKYTATTTAAVG